MSEAHAKRGGSGGRSAPGQVTLARRIEDALVACGAQFGDCVGVACSGGADSVALVYLLGRTRFARDLVILHVDHALRPDSELDAAFVRHLASHLGLECHLSTVTVHRSARVSLEAAARDARYGALERAAADLGLRWVATAHTLDDQAETVLLRAMRGGSLAGIAPARGVFVRPMLSTERVELTSWLTDEGIGWREDPTNRDERIERNWVRRVVLPMLRERRLGVAKVLARLADDARADAEVLDGMASAVVARSEVDDVGLLVRSADLDPLPGALVTRVVRAVLREMGSDPHRTDLNAIQSLLPGECARCSGATVWRLVEGLAFLWEPVRPPQPLGLPKENEGRAVDATGWGIRVRVGPAEGRPWVWRCAVPPGTDGLIVRSRVAGDRVRTHGGTRKVQDVLVDAKVPRPLRDLVPVIATDRGPLAVIGLTSQPASSDIVIDAQPADPTWSQTALWTSANA